MLDIEITVHCMKDMPTYLWAGCLLQCQEIVLLSFVFTVISEYRLWFDNQKTCPEIIMLKSAIICNNTTASLWYFFQCWYRGSSPCPSSSGCSLFCASSASMHTPWQEEKLVLSNQRRPWWWLISGYGLRCDNVNLRN